MSRNVFIAGMSLLCGLIIYVLFSPTEPLTTETASSISEDEVNKRSGKQKASKSADTKSRFNDSSVVSSAKRSGKRIDISSSKSRSEMSLEQIQELGELFKNEKNPKLRREAFQKLLDGMTFDNALEMRKYIAHLSPDDKEFIEFHMQYGAVAGDTAVEHGAETKERDMMVTLLGWAKADPNGALEWYKNLEVDGKGNFTNKTYLAEGMLRGLAENDTAFATEFLSGISVKDHSMRRMAQVLAGKVWEQSSSAKDLKSATSWADSLPDGKLKSYAQAEITKQYASKDPQAAVSWLATQESSSDNMKGSYYNAFSAWAGKDATAAGDYISTMPDSSNKDSAIIGLSVNLVNKDPQLALEWAGNINEPENRSKMLMYTGQMAFKKNTEGLKIWLPSSGLTAQNQQVVLRNHYRSLRKKSKK
jgi:hypothetical protein